MLNHSIKSNLSEVRDLTNILHGFCAKHKLNETLSSQLELILVEAVNNVIEHAYQNKQDLPIDTVFEASSTEITITIKDNGVVAPTAIYKTDTAMPDINELPEGGWGIALIHSLADHIEHSRKDGKNILVISKKTH